MIDLDHAATTPLDPRVRAAMLELLLDEAAQGNPSSVHRAGRKARSLVEQARRELAAALGVEPLEVTFTSGPPFGRPSRSAASTTICVCCSRSRATRFNWRIGLPAFERQRHT